MLVALAVFLMVTIKQLCLRPLPSVPPRFLCFLVEVDTGDSILILTTSPFLSHLLMDAHPTAPITHSSKRSIDGGEAEAVLGSLGSSL
jgi:hypothetical protein